MIIKKIFKAINLLLILLAILSFFIIVLYPSPKLNHPYTIEYTNENKDFEEVEIHSNSSKYVSIKNISTPLIKTLIMIEDQSFYSHNGLDYKRILKSLFTNLEEAEIVEGASTITQQLSRMIYLNNNQTMERKIKEAIISKKIEGSYTKNEILELYFNIVYFGHKLYGIEAATNYYFAKEPSEIDYAEASVLIAIINSPNKYAPDINLSLCQQKQKQILSLLFSRNVLSFEEYQNALEKEIKYVCNTSNNHLFSFYRDSILDEVKRRNLGNDIYQNGIKITSYYSKHVQNAINKVINKYKDSLLKEEDLAIVIMEPYSNKVLGLVGGVSYSKSTFNRAIDSKRQIGSTIKPIIYYYALQNGFSYDKKFTSEETVFRISGIGEYAPRNSMDKYANRKINLLEAISTSDNIYAMKTSLYLGIENIINHIKKYDIEIAKLTPTIALGTLELTPLELCSIYNSFASEGIYYPPCFIKDIKTYSNLTLYNDKKINKRVMLKNKTIEMNYLLRSPFDRAFNTYATPSLLNYQTNATFSAKTGTTSSSTWICGFNKKYTLCVYLGTDDNSMLSQTKIAKSIFQDLANSLCPTDIEFYRIPQNYETFSLTNKNTNTVSFKYIREKKLFA